MNEMRDGNVVGVVSWLFLATVTPCNSRSMCVHWAAFISLFLGLGLDDMEFFLLVV